jgi:transglutaminase-like putative cysteine protease
MRFRTRHTTQYRYAETVSVCYNEAHLIPRSFNGQLRVSSQVRIEPAPADYAERDDFFGNRASYFAIQQPHDLLRVTVTSTVDVQAKPDLEALLSNPTPWEEVRKYLRGARSAEALEARQFVLDSPLIAAGAQLASYVAPSFPPARPLLEGVRDLMGRVHSDFTYDPGFTDVATPLSDVLRHRRGVCQDFAQLAIGCLRAKGLAARYISGYLETVPPPGQERVVGADASHAWFCVFLPETGWVSFDPTNNQVPMDRHIVTAWGRDYSDVTPLRGVVFGGGKAHELEVAVDVTNVQGAPDRA